MERVAGRRRLFPETLNRPPCSFNVSAGWMDVLRSLRRCTVQHGCTIFIWASRRQERGDFKKHESTSIPRWHWSPTRLPAVAWPCCDERAVISPLPGAAIPRLVALRKRPEFGG